MSAMMRFCQNCKTERPLQEFYCEGAVDGKPCQWDLSSEAIRRSGDRPQEIATAESVQNSIGELTDAAAPTPMQCLNGHRMSDGDLMCLECGADLLEGSSAPLTTDKPVEETQVDGWRLLRQIAGTDVTRERYIAQHRDDNRQAVLTLYRAGAEPDPSVYEVIRRLPRAHVPEIIATGRWDNRAYEVAEELSGGTLADIGIALRDTQSIRHVVDELGRALHAFSEAGLRHRDLRPATLLVRSLEPLDLVISGFGSARLSEFDLDIATPLETTCYMAPEAIAGGVAAASDWWSLGMILLEQLTQGACFEGVNQKAFLIHVMANGVTLPDDIEPSLHLLLRGLLAKDRHKRWQWPQVNSWLAGEHVEAPSASVPNTDESTGASIVLGKNSYHRPSVFALAAAQRDNWAEALDHLQRGVLVTWAENAGMTPKTLAGIRHATQLDEIDDDWRLMIALKLLNPEMPLILRGDIVTPGWLLEYPLEGYSLITGQVPSILERLETETWLSRLRLRAEQVRNRARNLGIELDEEAVRINLLSTSRARLAALWEQRRLLLPDSDHPGVLSLSERRVFAEEDLIVLLSASIRQFRSVDAIIEQAGTLAKKEKILSFNDAAARENLALPRAELFRKIDDRIADFARTGNTIIDTWAEEFRLERRLPLHQAIVLLSVPPEQWLEPQKQQYVSQILEFFEKKVSTAVLRGPLVRMSIGKTTGRADLHELNGKRHSSSAILEHLLQRNTQTVLLDPAVITTELTLVDRLHALYRQTALYKRDTGIDGLYLGFPFLLIKDSRSNTLPRIAPVLLWPIKLLIELGSRNQVALAFDSEREEIRLNPALEGLLGREAIKPWRSVADEVLGRSTLKIADVMDAFGVLATAQSRTLVSLPSSPTITVGQPQLSCSGVLFHVTFMGQAIGEDLRLLKTLSPVGTALESMLRLKDKVSIDDAEVSTAEIDRFLTVASDPSQESAVLRARQSPGLLIEGPPGTGKSQTIVNMVADAIGRGKSLLIVCQKHAALEVVHKRLVAEGLGSRVIMLNDVNKDRERIVRTVREQLDTIFKGSAAFDSGWISRRKRMAARIEALEGELDRHHQALHHVDESTGLSYRVLLGELLQLEAGAPRLTCLNCARNYLRWISRVWPPLRSNVRRLRSTGYLPGLREARSPD